MSVNPNGSSIRRTKDEKTPFVGAAKSILTPGLNSKYVNTDEAYRKKNEDLLQAQRQESYISQYGGGSATRPGRGDLGPRVDRHRLRKSSQRPSN